MKHYQSPCRTGKRVYSSRFEAIIAASRINKRARKAGMACRSYRCLFCNMYHLTSQGKR